MYRSGAYWYNERMLAGVISQSGVGERYRQARVALPIERIGKINNRVGVGAVVAALRYAPTARVFPPISAVDEIFVLAAICHTRHVYRPQV